MGNKKYCPEETALIVSMFGSGVSDGEVVAACTEKFGTQRSKRSVSLHYRQNSESAPAEETGRDTIDPTTEEVEEPLNSDQTEE